MPAGEKSKDAAISRQLGTITVMKRADFADAGLLCHIFVCVNDRGGTRKSCADEASPELKDALKQGVSDRGWKARVRVSHSGCMGLCAEGPNVMIHPQGIWFRQARPSDAPAILDEVERLLGTAEAEGKRQD